MEPQSRLKELMAKVHDLELIGVLLVYSRDIFYYTGTAQPSYLAVFPDDYFLFIRSGFEFAVDEVFIGKEKVREERVSGKDLQRFFRKSQRNEQPDRNRAGHCYRRAVPYFREDFFWL